MAAAAAAGLVAAALAGEQRFLEPFVLCGSPVKTNEVPWQVAVIITRDDGEHVCGGTQISANAIITAAHCVTLPGLRQAVSVDRIITRVGAAGLSEGRAHAISEVIIHPSWKGAREPDGSDLGIDVAILRLSTPIIGPSTVPVRIMPVETPLGTGLVAGWGKFGNGPGISPTLLAGEVSIIPAAACRQILPREKSGSIGPHNVCTRSNMVVQCAGDSGGPLLIGTRDRPQLVGVSSWKIGKGCQFTGEEQIGVFAAGAGLTEFLKAHAPEARTTLEQPATFGLRPTTPPRSPLCIAKTGDWI